jgi:hypothetical protein
MKINKLIVLVSLFGLTLNSNAQLNPEIKYRRSSLSMIMIETDKLPNKEAVMSSWNNYPFPDKYNKHNIIDKSININSIKLTDKDLFDAGFLRDSIKGLKVALAESAYNSMLGNAVTKSNAKPIRFLNNEKTLAFVLPTEKQEFQIKIEKLIKERKLGNQMVASWYNKSKDGKFDMNLISERGFYNASELEANIAKGQIKGTASLADAGEELIKNTFLTFTKLDEPK